MLRSERLLISSLLVVFGITFIWSHLRHAALEAPELAYKYEATLLRQRFQSTTSLWHSSKNRSENGELPSNSVSLSGGVAEHRKQPQQSGFGQTVHDNRSLTSFMWLRGKPFNILDNDTPPVMSNNITIDALSIGTHYNVNQMIGQASSWGSHWSMRYLFGTTERDDADPDCHLKLKKRIFEKIFPRCACMKYEGSPLRGIRKRFPIPKWIEKENKTRGWLCAQQRFAHAVGKVSRFYQRQGSLPDFLMIQDDDTWWGMNQMVSFLAHRNQSKPFVAAGCMIQWPVYYVNFSFPFGGFGMVLNRKSIERLIQPLYCNRTTAGSSFTNHACSRLEDNLVGERMAFQDGMSIGDVMDRHAEMLPYRKFFAWRNDPGYCMLGDWVLGYYVNYYKLGTRTNRQLDYVHMNRELGYDYNNRERSCLNFGEDACRSSPTQYVCHRIQPDVMLQLHEIDAKKAVDVTFQRVLRPSGGKSKHSASSKPIQDQGFLSLPKNVTIVQKVQVKSSTLFSHMWYRGKVFDQLLDTSPRPRTGASFIMDALSIGSQSTMQEMEGQALSWGSHPSVRFLFGTTESDDADPQCHETMTKADVHDILSRCSVTEQYSRGLRALGEGMKLQNWTEMEEKGVDWLCAQQRLAHAVGKIGRFYRKDGWLPDYLILQEADTWLGTNQIIRYLQSRDNSRPFAVAGCMIHWLMDGQDFSFPFSGFGFMINRPSIERLIQPIYCNGTNKDAYTERACLRLVENRMGELMAFEDGMSLSDVMDRHAEMLPYREHRTWDEQNGYCMLGDWVMGYYVNYYELGTPVSPEYPFLHIDSRLGYSAHHPGRSCANVGRSACDKSKTRYSCRHIEPEDMRKFTELDYQKANDTKDHYM